MPGTKKQKNKRKARIKKDFRMMLYDHTKCIICGKKAPIGFKKGGLEYHHINGLADKKMNIGRMLKDGYSPKTIWIEAEKCVPLCHSCHVFVHKNKINILEMCEALK